MSHNSRSKMKAIRQAIEKQGFKLLDITKTPRNSHFKCRIEDDKGNVFHAFTGGTCSSNPKIALLNFSQDVRRLSQQAKGLIG